MAVFRIEKTRDYTVMSNPHLKDRTLTLKSTALLSMMLSLPDEWNYTTSGLAANPLVGAVSDEVVKAGGTAVLSETTEFIGAEKLLVKRAVNAKVSVQILEIVRHYEDAMKCVNDDVRKRNPSPGNKAGGITTLEEKSLVCIYKSGHAPIQAVYDYAQDIHHKGLVIMDTPGNDPISMSGMVAGGFQLVLFTTGRGTPTGNPIVPVIKLSANRDTAVVMRDNLDFDASGYLYGSTTMRQLRDALLEEICEVAGGKLTRSEILGYCETAIARVGRGAPIAVDGCEDLLIFPRAEIRSVLEGKVYRFIEVAGKRVGRFALADKV